MGQGQRTVTGPGFDLVLDDSANTATLWFHKAFRGHPELGRGFGDAGEWLRAPRVPGLAGLTGEVQQGAFTYAAHPALSVRELVDTLKAQGNACGPRACVDFLRVTGEVLIRASRLGARVGVYAHGAVTPWTVLVDDDGGVQVLGYAMPRVDVYGYLDDDAVKLPGDALRYTAPEVLDNNAEELSSDLMALCLVGVEVLTGHHAYVGDADEVLDQIHRGEGPVAMAELGEGYPSELVVILARATSRQSSDRYRRGSEFLRALDSLPAFEGPGLTQVVRTAKGTPAESEPEDIPVLDLDDELTGDVPIAVVEFDEEEPDDDAFDPEPTQQLGHIEPVEPLSGGVTLERVQAHATAVVERAGQVAERARELAQICQEEGRPLGLEAAADVDRAASAARRAEKARDSARGASNLVDMDETAAEAQVTLTLVHGAARQADVALSSAIDALTDIRRSAHRIAGEMEQVDAARAEAPAAVARARSGVRAIARAADAVRSEVSAGRLPEDAGRQALDDLRRRGERALRVAEEAETALKQATLAEVADAALQRLIDAATGAESAGAAAGALLDTLRAEVDRARLEAVDSADRSHRAIVERLSRLTDRLESAQSAHAVSPTPDATEAIAAASAIRDTLDAHRQRAEDAVRAAQESQVEAEAQAQATVAREALEQVDALLPQATETVQQAVQSTRLAAEALARRTAASRDAQRVVEQATAALNTVREVMDRLTADTQEVRGGNARAAIREATTAWSALQRAGVEARGHAARVGTAPTAQESQDALAGTRDSAAGVTSGADRVLSLARTAREACNREIAELRRERQAAQALSEAVEEARVSAEACGAAVAHAQTELSAVNKQVERAQIDEARRLRDIAAEVIDIAAYQSSEAADAARQAKTQAHADEASRYADTARSFRERIEEDLPAAHQALAKAVAVIEEDGERRTVAVDRLNTMDEAVTAAKQRWTEVMTAARHDARGWTHAEVQDSLGALEELGPDIEAQVQRVTSARRRADDADAAEVVESAASQAHEAAARVEALLQRVEAASAALHAALEAARTESDAIRDARETVSRARTQVAAAKDTLRATLTATQNDLLPFMALGTTPGTASITAGMDRLQQMMRRVEEVAPELELLSDGVSSASTRKQAEPFARQATDVADEVEALVDGSASIASDLLAEAQAEAESKATEARRRRDEAVRVVRAADERASALRDKVELAIDGARDEIGSSDSDDAHDRFAAATRGAMRVAAACERLQDLVERLSHDDPELLAPETQPLVDLAESCATDVSHALEQAMDSARRAVEEASALQTVREEVATLGGRARAAVEVARIRSSEVSLLVQTAERPSTQEVAQRARSAVSIAEKAAKKAAAAGPMVGLVAELAAAEPIVRAARLSAERAEEVAASVAELLDEARRRVGEEEAEAQRRLEEARSDARHPLSQARAAVARAQGFVTATDAEAKGIRATSVQSALAALRSAADDVRVRAGETVRIGEALPAAAHLDAVLGLAERIRVGTDATLAALGEATQRMEAARAAIQVHRETFLVIERAQNDILDAATSAQEAATGCRNTLDALGRSASDLPDPVTEVEAALTAMDAAADRAETAAANALGLSLEAGDVDRPALATDMADRAQQALEAAIAELARVVELDRKARAAIDRAREDAARAAVEAEQNDRRRLPRRTRGSGRSERLRSRLEASGAPRPTRETRERIARGQTYNSEVSDNLSAAVPRAAAPSRPAPPPALPPAETPGTSDSSEDRIARLRQSLRAAGGPARNRSERMAERRATEGRAPREPRASRTEPPPERLPAPRQKSFETGSHPVPTRPAPSEDDDGDSATDARRKKREALRARLRRSRTDD